MEQIFGQTQLVMPTPLSIALVGSSSTIAIPSLDTIPGSAAQTPGVSDTESVSTPPPLTDALPSKDAVPASPPSTYAPSDYLTPLEGPQSRRSSIADNGVPNGPYFSLLGASRARSLADSPGTGASTPLDRPRPTPIEIPSNTPERPLFSAYPDQGPRGNNAFPSTAFTLSQPPLRRIRDSTPESSASASDSPSDLRRASAAGLYIPKVSEERRPSLGSHTSAPARPPKSPRRRRSSISGHEFEDGRYLQWTSMAREEARRLQFGHEKLPFSYEPRASDHVQSPHISSRRSSLQQATSLGLSNVTPVFTGDLLIPADLVQPHDPPPRKSSIDHGRRSSIQMSSADHGAVGEGSVVSSQTGTSTSAEFFSTSPSSKEHPLSSATTSLSRSAKSAKEGEAEEKAASLSALRLQRSLEWEARQTRHRQRLEKKRMILLELVETEVAYMDDLNTLVTIYLPQLYALPSVSERTADMVARNARDLLDIHVRVAGKMVDVLKEEHLGYEPHPEPDVSRQLETVARKLAGIFVEEAACFSAYNEYCAGSIAAATLVRQIALRPEYNAYERRCQIISASQPHPTLKDLLRPPEQTIHSLPSSPTPHHRSNRSRLHFRDFLIMPVQRVCRYPLLLKQLLVAESPRVPDEDGELPAFGDEVDGDYDPGVDVERALGAMRGVAEEADEARRVKESEIKSATIIERLEPHGSLSPAFLRSLGSCRLIGSLDVLHYHPTVAPLTPPVKVRYMGAFLYKGYLVLAKVKKGKVYEARHYLPLEVFELIDIAEGFLPHSIRLSLRDHCFDLAASCEAEKEVWVSALSQARDESTLPPFELPASVSPFAASRPRRMSALVTPDAAASIEALPKRHTVALSSAEMEGALQPDEAGSTYFQSPAASPVRSTFGFTPDRRHSSILLRRASATQRMLVDRSLLDVFSESCATARSKAQLHQTLFHTEHFVPSSTITRRRSFLDLRASPDISFTGKIRGSVMPIRQTRSLAGKKRQSKRFTGGNESSTEVDHRVDNESADETATDFGATTRGLNSRAQSVISLSRSHSPPPPVPVRQDSGLLGKRKSLTNLRKSFIGDSDSLSSLTSRLTLSRRTTASSQHLRRPPSRAKSMPVSPVASPTVEIPPLPSPFAQPSDVFAGSWTRGTENMQGDSKGAWTTLRRSMSFVRDGRKEEARPTMSRHSSGTDGEMSVYQSDKMSGEEDNEKARDGPRRRKSVRLFQTLSRFTPI